MNVQSAIDLAAVYRELQSYVRWLPDDAPLVVDAFPIIADAVPLLVDDFYEEIQRHPLAMQVITGGGEQISRLKQSLTGWLTDLFSGCYDNQFIAKRWRIGQRHVEIGLDQHFATAALSRLRLGVCENLTLRWRGGRRRLARTLAALQRLIDLDITVIQLAYQQHYVNRLEEDAKRQLRQSERLASIGQMVTGLAHESRNMLQRSHACLETLILDIGDRPEALTQAQRIQAALDQLHLLYEEVRNFAAPILLDLEPIDVDRTLHLCWQHLEARRKGRKFKFDVVANSNEKLTIRADRMRMEQVFTNILQNAIDACQDQDQPEVHCQLSKIPNSNQCQISIQDNGQGLNGDIHRLFDPFFTTKPKGTGLGLAITKRIIDAHSGTIRLENRSGGGVQVVIRLKT